MSIKSQKTAPKKCRKVPFFFECEFCPNKYKSRQGLWVHKKKKKKNISLRDKNENNKDEILDIILKK